MRVLHLLSSCELSGAEQVAINICTGLQEEVDFAYASPRGPIGEVLAERGISYLPLQGMNRSEVCKAITAFKPDIIHAHDYRASVYAALQNRSIKVVSHLHANYPWAQRVNGKTLIYRLLSFRFYRIAAVSSSIINEFYFKEKIISKAVVLPNVVSISKLQGLSLADAEQCDLLFVGRMTEEKAPLNFIELVSRIKENRARVKAVMLGSGPMEEDCRQKCREDGLTDNLHMPGFQKNPYKYMGQAKVLVMPSLWEGFGLVALEAMALGLPVLCSPVGGLVDVVADGETGFHCCSVEEFVQRAELLLKDEELRNKMSQKSKLRAEQLSDTGAYLEKVKKLYDTAIM